MTLPSATASYLALLALLYTVLSFNVIRLRRGNKIGFGDGGHPGLSSAIRAHANFAEYVPVIVILVGALEMHGASRSLVHALMGTLLLARVLHPFGMFAKPGSLPFTVGRVLGTALTTTLLVVSALMVLARIGSVVFFE